MKTQTELFPFETLLKAYTTHNELLSNSATNEQEQALVFSQPIQYEVALPDDRVKVLIQQVAKALSKETLGTVVSHALAGRNIEKSVLQKKTGLTHSMVEAISNDVVYTNSVPIKSLVKLLKLLGITAENALSAIEATFDKLLTENNLLQAMPAYVQPSFRKGVKRGDVGNDFPHSKVDESYLYQNKEALNKYTTRLAELYELM